MEEMFTTWLNVEFLGHGQCYLWRNDLIALHAVSDSLIALAYYTIPAALWVLIRKRRDLEYRWMFGFFAAFILACGTTHLMAVWNIWHGDYYLSGAIKAATAGVSLMTAALIWPLIPRVVALPSPSQLAETNTRLKEAVAHRDATESQLRQAQEELEMRVEERTRELTLAKQALEEEVRERRRMEDRFRRLFEASPNGMAVVNEEGEIETINDTAAGILGYQPDELVSRTIDTFIPELGRSKYAAADNMASLSLGARGDVVGLHKQGGYIPIEVGINPVDEQQGTSLIVTLTDISQRKWFEAEQKRQNQRLKHSNEELEQFAFIASHDLREPLRKLLSFTQLLMTGRYGDFNEKGTEFVGYIREAAQRMEALLDSLLSYSRVTTQGKAFAPVDLNQVLSEVREDLQLRLEEVEGRLELEPLPSELLGDRAQLRQLFQNLISNSLKYCKDDQPPVVRISARQPDPNHWEISVADNGIGFDEQYKDQIFEVFRRLHGRMEYSGTGMGLAICRKIVERHQGTIDVTSTPGEGSTFAVTLPV
ncbi:ATP-binding protein [Marinobacteraceae bacterium S3BR75-40.1]